MRRAVMVVLASVLMLAMLVPGLSCSSTELDEYVLGALFSTTGSGENLGKPEKNTIDMLVDQINEAGGVNGKPLRVVFYNDESDAVKAASLATRLIEQDKVLAIIGPTTSTSSMAIKDIVTTKTTPNVSCAASIDIITPIADSYWVFKTPQTEVEAIVEIYTYLQDQDVTKVALLTDTSTFGAAGRKYLKSEASKFGITIVQDLTFDSADTSMITQLTTIKGSDAEVVVSWATDKESAQVAKDMKTLNMTIPLYLSHGVANKGYLDNAGDAANGTIFPAGKLLFVDEVPDTDPQKEALTSYRDDYEALYGAGTINTFGGHAYDALHVIVMALERLGDSLDGKSLADARKMLRDEIEKTEDFAGTGGVFTMSATDHLGMAPGSLALIKVVDGQWTWHQ